MYIKTLEFLKKYIGDLLTVLGTGICAYNVFNFSSSGGIGGRWVEGGVSLPTFPTFGRYEFEYVAYYYTSDTLLYIALGAMLVVGGLLIIKRNSERRA